MRRLICAVLLAMALSTNVGCFIPIYSAEKPRRARQLLFTSENLRMFLDEWERIWMLEMPDHMGPYRTHGGVI